MQIQKISISKLKPAKYNPRVDLQPGTPMYEKIKRSIQEFGYVEPIIVNQRNNTIVGGHQRLKILKELGEKEIDCVIVDLDEKREKALNVALNKATGTWEIPALKDLLESIDDGSFDVTLTGFDLEEIELLMTQTHQEEPKKKEKEPKIIVCPKCGHEFEAFTLKE